MTPMLHESPLSPLLAYAKSSKVKLWSPVLIRSCVSSGYKKICSFLKNGTILASFCLFSSFSRYNFNNTNWKKRRCCAWPVCHFPICRVLGKFLLRTIDSTRSTWSWPTSRSWDTGTRTAWGTEKALVSRRPTCKGLKKIGWHQLSHLLGEFLEKKNDGQRTALIGKWKCLFLNEPLLWPILYINNQRRYITTQESCYLEFSSTSTPTES